MQLKCTKLEGTIFLTQSSGTLNQEKVCCLQIKKHIGNLSVSADGGGSCPLSSRTGDNYTGTNGRQLKIFQMGHFSTERSAVEIPMLPL